MKQIPTAISSRYLWELNRKQIPKRQHPFYLNWLRYYLDFCLKYDHDASLSKNLPLFLTKLYEKNKPGSREIRQQGPSIYITSWFMAVHRI